MIKISKRNLTTERHVGLSKSLMADFLLSGDTAKVVGLRHSGEDSNIEMIFSFCVLKLLSRKEGSGAVQPLDFWLWRSSENFTLKLQLPISCFKCGDIWPWRCTCENITFKSLLMTAINVTWIQLLPHCRNQTLMACLCFQIQIWMTA